MNAGTPFTGMSPRYTANTPIAPSPAPSAASSLPVNAERDLSTAISRLMDDNSPVCLATLQKEYQEYWAGLKSFDQRVFNAPGKLLPFITFITAKDVTERLRKLLQRFGAVENHLRASGLGALPLNGEIDLASLGVMRAKEAQELFVKRQKGERPLLYREDADHV